MYGSFDVVVVGSGIAGLSFARKVADLGHKVCILTKKDRAESNTNYAQGGIAAVTSKSDDIELHVEDTLTAGDGLCNEDAVRTIVREGPDRIQELINLGVAFSQLDDGRVSLHKEGGHSKRRILHVKDLTGKAIEAALLHAVETHSNVTLLEHVHAIDLITNHKLHLDEDFINAPAVIHGLYGYDTRSRKIHSFAAPTVMLCTGGIGQVYFYTTNPRIATGDGIAMAYRAGAEVRNMEFIQFHPTALFSHSNDRFLISEAVRGEGAILRNLNGEAFMEKYDERKELAPRDIVARAIDSEMKKSGASHVWLDISHKSEAFIQERFPHIFERCEKEGINPAKDPIPVVPAMHYLCGGVATNMDAETGITGLYACGEVACTGLHGANRLASNSLLEAVVMAHRGALKVHAFLSEQQGLADELPEWVDGNLHGSDERVILSHNLDELKRALWDYVGIVRTTKRLIRARTRIRNLKKEIHDYYWNFKVESKLLELRNLVEVAEMIIECALERNESRGLHYTRDFPEKSPVAVDSIVHRRTE